MVRVYYTHFNGDRPYKVVFDGKNVDIFTYEDNDENMYAADNSSLVHNVHIKSYKNFERSFIGKYEMLRGMNGQTARRRRRGSKQSRVYLDKNFGLGNSILIHLKDKRYVFIGHKLYEFEVDDEIVEYYSNIGNNDVPYAVAVGKNNVYFMSDLQYIDRKYFQEFPTKYSWKDYAYTKFYESFSGRKRRRPRSTRKRKRRIERRPEFEEILSPKLKKNFRNVKIIDKGKF